MEVWIEDTEKVENKDVVNKDENMGDKEDVRFDFMKELEKKEKGNKTMRSSIGWSCHSIVEKTMGSYPRSPKLMQRRK